MNYLAHLFLADDTTDSMVGSLLGDFVKGSVADRFGLEIKLGIELHRKVDVFTDSHPVVRRSKGRIHTDRRRLAGIIVDIFYDHFLAKNWQDYSAFSLADFSRRVHDALGQRSELLPDRLKASLPSMIRNDWPASYRDIAAIEAVLARTSRRLSRENTLARAIDDLIAGYDRFEADFRNFFPDLIRFAEGYKKQQRERKLYEIA
jgi:acyl carrier protein phosphodiesterase